MPPKETTDAIRHLAGVSPKNDLRKLAAEAREAYEQKRTKDCLDLVQAILLIDPDHATAQWMRSSIESELQPEIDNARKVPLEPESKVSTGKHAESEKPPVREPALPKTILAWAVVSDWQQNFRRHPLVFASGLIALSFVIANFYFFLFRPNTVDASRIESSFHSSKPVEEANSGTPIPSPGVSERVLSPFAPPPAPVREGASLPINPPVSVQARPVPPAPPAKNRVVSGDPVPSVASPSARPLNLPDPPVVPRANGTLAVSSPASLDIYKDDTYIGSAPVSLDLPSGLQTLEYHHGGLTKKVTYQINSNETTRATIAFDVDLQINSKPWAEVFLDGVERKALGQTPLSGVRVPIGSVLVFQNPGFPEKRYRVTGNETGIQMVFP
jgi:hypothetical protein